MAGRRRHDLAIRHPPLSSERKMNSMSYRPHPSTDRALNQLARHDSGTPNDMPPPMPTWAQGLAAIRDALPTFTQACENIGLWQAGRRKASAWTDHPTDGQLRAAGANLMVGRLQSDLDALLASSWRGRLALRLGRWTVALQQAVRDIIGGILGAPRGVRRVLADIDAGLLHGWRL